MKSYKDLFLTLPNAQEHVQAIQADKEMYYATLMMLLESDISLDEQAKAVVLATLLTDAKYKNNYNRDFLNYLFGRYDFGIREIRDAIWLMRNGKLPPKRHYRQSKEQYRVLREAESRKKGPSPTGRRLNRRQRDVLKEILYKMSPHDLERSYATNVEIYREVFDFLHTNPKNFQLDWFQEATYGGPVPDDSYIGLVRSLNAENAVEYLHSHRIPLKEYRKRMRLDPTLLHAFSERADLKSLVRQRSMLFSETKDIEDTHKDGFDAVLAERINNYRGILYLNYGECIEVLEDETIGLELRKALAKQVQRNLSRFPVPLHGRVRLVLDNSPSMERAVVVAFHLLLLLSLQVENPEIVMVNRSRYTKQEIEYKFGVTLPPEDILEAVGITKAVKCEGMTNLACSLQDVLQEEESKFDSLIFLTDECENQRLDGSGLSGSWSHAGDHGSHGTFAWALEKYSKEIHQRILQTVVVNIPSKGSGSYCKRDPVTNALLPYFGMTKAIREKGLPIQTYVVDSIRHVEYFLAMLNADTPLFHRDVLKTRDLLRDQGIVETTKKIRLAKKQLSLARVLVLTNGTCKCGGLFQLEQIGKFRLGETIQCSYCDKTFTPSFF